MKTIAAISTPLGSGGIAVVRISGADALKIAQSFFRPTEILPRHAHFGRADLDGFFDNCILIYYKAPHSYTGEDTVEISCHGGEFVAQALLKKCLTSGAVLAEAGEFTRRAFLNGKLSLSDAEGVIDLINSQSTAEANAACFLADGQLSRTAKNIQDRLTDILAEVEAAIDYPEEFDFLQKDKIAQSLQEMTASLHALTKSFAYGKILKNGLNVVIAGRPNAGKSSLLNALLHFDRAIVTATAGTTRDTLSETLLVRDIKVNLTDTAGIREESEEIEKMGVERSKKALQAADIVLYVFDSQEGLTEEDGQILSQVKGKKVLRLANKCDLAPCNLPDTLCISATTGKNLALVSEAIYNFARSMRGGNITLTNERHLLVLEKTAALLQDALASLEKNTADLIASDLAGARQLLGEITGSTASEEVINRIFAKFCLGK